MGASSIYRHVKSKHELLVLELAEAAGRGVAALPASADDKSAPTRERVQRFLEVQHALLASDADLVVIALRATTYPEAPVARRALALQDRAIGLLTEIAPVARRDLAPSVDALAAGRALVPRRERRAGSAGRTACSRAGVPPRGRRIGRPLVPRIVGARRLEIRVALDFGGLLCEPARVHASPVHARCSTAARALARCSGRPRR